MRNARTVGCLVLLLALALPRIALSETPAADAVHALRRFAGAYRWVGGDEEVRRIDAAIDACVKRMNFFIRGIARRRIRPGTLPAERLTIAIDDAWIRIESTGHPALSAPADGAPIDWRDPAGDHFQASQGLDDRGALYQRFVDGRSRTLNRYLLDAEGRHLTIETIVESKYMPEPLRFTKTYERAGD